MASGASFLGQNNIVSLQVASPTGGEAFMSFSRTGVFGAYFGVDSNNDLCFGGWSLGAVKHRVLHEGNLGTNTAFNARVLTIISERSSSQQAHVRDITNWDPTGVNDMRQGLQDLIDQAETAGVPIVGDHFYARLDGTINLPAGFVFKGARSGPSQIWNANSRSSVENNRASTFLINHTGKGFTNKTADRFDGGITISNMGTRRNQPAPNVINPATGGWTPAANDYDFYFPTEGDVSLDRVHMHNATKGIYANGDRIDLDRITGQCFDNALRIDWSYDVVRLANFHLWPYWSQDSRIFDYQHANLDAIRIARVDNPRMYAMFIYAARRALSVEHYPGVSPFTEFPAGSTSKLYAYGFEADYCRTAYYVAPEVNGHTSQFYGITGQGPNVPVNVPMIDIQGNFVSARLNGFVSTQCGGTVVDVTGASNRVWVDAEIGNYNNLNIGAPAIRCTQASSQVHLLEPSRVLGGAGGAPVFSGSGLGMGVDRTYSPLVTASAGTIGAYTSSMTYRIDSAGWVDFSLTISISNIGSASGVILVGVPFAAGPNGMFFGREVNVTGQSLSATLPAGGLSATIVDDDNNTALVNGSGFLFSGRYRSNIGG